MKDFGYKLIDGIYCGFLKKKGVSWTYDTPLYFLFILSEYLIHDYSNGAIAGYIAGGAETVHRNIEGYHECLHISIET